MDPLSLPRPSNVRTRDPLLVTAGHYRCCAAFCLRSPLLPFSLFDTPPDATSSPFGFVSFRASDYFFLRADDDSVCLRAPTDRGASFGLGAIINQVSAEAFGGQLGRIVPRLFRYRFDPSSKTRAAMDQLWRAVVGGGGGSGEDFSTREKEVCGCVPLAGCEPYRAQCTT